MFGRRIVFVMGTAAVLAFAACDGDDTTTVGVGGGAATSDHTVASTTTASSTNTSGTSGTSGTTGDGGGGRSGGEGGEGGAATTAAGTGGAMPGDCADPLVAADPSMSAGTTVGAPSVSNTIDCDGFPTGAGSELVYLVTPAIDGTLSVTLDIGDPDMDLALYAETACGDASTLVGCMDDAYEGEQEVLLLPVSAGVPVFIYVDGYEAGDASAFTLDVVTIAAEITCQNYTDDDADSLIDCEDASSCQALPECAPGPTPTGGACTLHNQCAANDNDPFCLDAVLHGVPGGYCSEFCDKMANDCGGDNVCVALDPPLPSGKGVCLAGCAMNADCRQPEYSCQPLGPASVCVPDSCGVSTVAALGDNAGDNSTGFDSMRGACAQGSGGPESVFTFTPGATGNLTITLSSMVDLQLFVRSTCNNVMSEIDCTDAQVGGVNETLVIPVTVDVPITIVVDGFDGGAGPFTLSLVLS
jgi:hypothetical protein